MNVHENRGHWWLVAVGSLGSLLSTAWGWLANLPGATLIGVLASVVVPTLKLLIDARLGAHRDRIAELTRRNAEVARERDSLLEMLLVLQRPAPPAGAPKAPAP